jgi:hypothetical protein
MRNILGQGSSHINLWEGRSPNDEKKGVSPDKDTWEIITKEKKPQKEKIF